ncbi:hypothetical protein LCI18_006471 [Fusarium solani-melongenae]|uniref:Uncharacterized protein n=1 Tax=Fusarium solani subsp. cucurbitae TaxID=2747967 RepID=A0ACD3Z2Z6_FUSSC|nr:hypothetical protein LCI18_006471 [Fusarium solani-melongenae]
MRIADTKLEWAFFGVAVAQFVLVTLLQISVLVRYLDWVNPAVYQVPLSYVIPMVFVIPTFGCLFQATVALDTCRIKNKIQIWAQCVINICLSVTAGMQYVQAKEATERILKGHDMFKNPFADNDEPFWKYTQPALIACIVLFSVCSILMVTLACWLHVEFSWTLYEHVSPDVKMKARHLRYQAYLVCLKISLLFVILFVVVYGFLNVHYEEPEFGLTMAILPIAVIQAGLAAYCVTNEHKKGMFVVIALHLGLVGYLVSRLTILFGKGRRSKTLMKEEMVLFAAMGLFLSIVSAIAAAICTANFDKGLKPLLLGQEQRNLAPPQEFELTRPRPISGVFSRPERMSRRFDID